MSTVNIDSKGYGKIYKAVMRNPKLPLLAKTIYAYFCAYAGNTTKAFPKRDKIVRDLKMNKDTYTKHLNTLVSEGYIAKERTASGNIYTIMQTVPGYETYAKASEDKKNDILAFESVQAKGFGTVPKLIMLDVRLTAQAKAIYAYFASFAGAGTTAFPRRNTIMRELKLSVNTYYDHFNSLIETGYITVEQHKTDGRFDVCIYHLSDCVESPTKEKHGEAVSEKLRHGKNGNSINNNTDSGDLQAPMSEELIHGEEVLKTVPVKSEKPMSEKLRYEKTVSQNFGHPNNNNISTRNSYFMSKQEYNHHNRRFQQPKGDTPIHSFSLQEIKQRMNFERLQREAAGWGNLKERLGHFNTSTDKEHYFQVIGEILDELTLQLTAAINEAESPERILAVLESDAFNRLFDDLLDRWEELRSVKGYVATSLKNMLKCARA